jgi:hypothetical protein
MPKITVQSDRAGERAEMTLSERIVAAHLDDGHYAAQLLERLAWAAADAEALEAQTAAATLRGPRLGHEGSRQMPDPRKSVERSSDDQALPLEAEGMRRRVVAPR